jgi:hypothetical protein
MAENKESLVQNVWKGYTSWAKEQFPLIPKTNMQVWQIITSNHRYDIWRCVKSTCESDSPVFGQTIWKLMKTSMADPLHYRVKTLYPKLTLAGAFGVAIGGIWWFIHHQENRLCDKLNEEREKAADAYSRGYNVGENNITMGLNKNTIWKYRKLLKYLEDSEKMKLEDERIQKDLSEVKLLLEKIK